jgi:hypothetical protein
MHPALQHWSESPWDEARLTGDYRHRYAECDVGARNAAFHQRVMARRWLFPQQMQVVVPAAHS